MEEAWYQMHEQSAGALRIRLLWLVYRVFGKNALKIAIVPVMAAIYPFCGRARAALRSFHSALSDYAAANGLDVPPLKPFRHLLAFAWSLADKLDACTLKKDLPAVTVRDDDAWRRFRALVDAGGGAFRVGTHVGTLEVLPALAASKAAGARVPRVHAFQQLGHDAVFTRFFLEHLDRDGFDLKAVEDIGVETAVEMEAAIARGDLVLMAGDRESAGRQRSNGSLTREFLGRQCRWPKGVFTFARLMHCPVFAVSCTRTGWNSFEARFRALDASSNDALLEGYVGFLQEEAAGHPGEWYHFHDFFAGKGE